MFTSRRKNKWKNHIMTANKYIKIVTLFKYGYIGSRVQNQTRIHAKQKPEEEIKFGNVCCHPAQSLLPSSLSIKTQGEK
jgi:hypothetical protein